jgi:hypothetical protein
MRRDLNSRRSPLIVLQQSTERSVTNDIFQAEVVEQMIPSWMMDVPAISADSSRLDDVPIDTIL